MDTKEIIQIVIGKCRLHRLIIASRVCRRTRRELNATCQQHGVRPPAATDCSGSTLDVTRDKLISAICSVVRRVVTAVSTQSDDVPHCSVRVASERLTTHFEMESHLCPILEPC